MDLLEWFKTSVGVRQWCLLSPMLFNVLRTNHMLFMMNNMDGHVGTVSIGGRQLTKLRFADDINGLTSRETELQQLVNRI